MVRGSNPVRGNYLSPKRADRFWDPSILIFIFFLGVKKFEA
jgi:hypothetical protein